MVRLQFFLGTFIAGAFLYLIGETSGNTWCLVGSCALPLIGFLMLFLPSATIPQRRSMRTEQGYLISTNKRICNVGSGYQMVVNGATMRKAMETGDYTFERKATAEDAGNHYYNGDWIPGGHIPKQENVEFYDERLNKGGDA